MQDFELAKSLFLEGLKCFEQEQYADAEVHFSRTLQIIPDRLSTLTNLSATLIKLRRIVEAREFTLKALELDENSEASWLNLGLISKELFDLNDAIDCFEKALSIKPDYAEAWSNKGAALNDLRRHDEALTCCNTALNINPDYAEAWSNKGAALNDLRHYDEALACHDASLRLRPGNADAWYNKGITLTALKRYDEALASYDSALKIDPEFADAHWNEALVRLTLEEFEAGWKKYEYRWKRRGHDEYRHAGIRRLEDLNSVANQKVLVWCEQGLGDTIQFGRYIPMLATRGAEVIFEVQAPLKALMGSLTNCAVIGRDEPFEPVDCQLPLLSLPLLFGTARTPIPNEVPYLRVGAAKVKFWNKQLDLSGRGLNIGIACSGNINHKNDHSRSIELQLFKPLSEASNLFLIQKDIRAQDRQFLTRHPEIRFIDDELGDFEDTAAVVQNMDLIISVDTSLAHLAGALGKPLFVLLAWAPEWRWLLDRSDIPWYPTAKLFRQPSMGDWESVVRDVAIELRRF